MQQGSFLIVGLIVVLEVVALTIAHWSIFQAEPVPTSTDAAAYQPTNIVTLSSSANRAAPMSDKNSPRHSDTDSPLAAH